MKNKKEMQRPLLQSTDKGMAVEFLNRLFFGETDFLVNFYEPPGQSDYGRIAKERGGVFELTSAKNPLFKINLNLDFLGLTEEGSLFVRAVGGAEFELFKS